MTTVKVQISVGLLEKLAGIRKEPQRKQQQHQQHVPLGLPKGFGIPFVPHISHHHSAEGPDAAFQQQIKHSQRVGTLLLKAEDEEISAVQRRADELIQQYSPPARAICCGEEQQAVLDCYKQHPADVLQCSGFVNAYAACARAATGQLMR